MRFTRLTLVPVLLLAAHAQAKDPAYVGSVDVVRDGGAADMARGTVFLDANRHSHHLHQSHAQGQR